MLCHKRLIQMQNTKEMDCVKQINVQRSAVDIFHVLLQAKSANSTNTLKRLAC